MGTYTEIYVNIDLKEDTPLPIIDILRKICNAELIVGAPARWQFLFRSGSSYTPNTWVANLTFSEIGGYWSLLGKGDIKNYSDEIELFFEFIKPFTEDYFLGYLRSEDDPCPELFYNEPANLELIDVTPLKGFLELLNHSQTLLLTKEV